MSRQHNEAMHATELSSRYVDTTGLPTPEGEIALTHIIQRGGPDADAARARFAAANHRLVVAVARRYAGHGVELDDLIQEGEIGLLTAISKFDPARGLRFSTMAMAWIRQAIAIAVANQARTVRVPAYIHVAHTHLSEDPSLLSDEAIAAATGLSLAQAGHLRSAPRSISLALPLGGEGELEDVIADPGASPEEEVVASIFSEDVRRILRETLTPREYVVIQQRFGLGGQDERELAPIGRDLGRSRERIRQIMEQALGKLRQSPQVMALRA